jgi:hypothetical protein
MDWPTRVKLGLATAAAILFAGSMWTHVDWLRWVAIGLLAVAFLLRFVYPGARR